jgi:alkylation response protein AidB-like acyl-CoA dehydrogenase
MHFAFDEDQLAFRAQLRAFAEKECTVADVRDAWASELGWSRARWASLADMGVVGLTVPAEHGGMGLGLVDLVLLLEEAGRSGLPEPLLETTAVAVPALLKASSANAEAARGRWLAPAAAGETVIAVGVGRPSAKGSSSFVSGAGSEGADLMLLERDGELHALAAADVSVAARASLDGSRRLAEVAWAPSPSTVLADGAEAKAVLDALRWHGATGAAALLVGIGDRLIAMAAEYAQARHQFGKPIGSFQAVKHHLANAAIRVEFARPAVYRAAWSLTEDDPDAGVHASMAKALASDAATLAAGAALQVHGAIGYTWEHDLHLWMKRAWTLAAAWGDAAEHRAFVLEELGARA